MGEARDAGTQAASCMHKGWLNPNPNPNPKRVRRQLAVCTREGQGGKGWACEKLGCSVRVRARVGPVRSSHVGLGLGLGLGL